MKIISFFLVALLPIIARPQDKVSIRKLGTNLFDFTPLMQSLQRGEITDSPYLVAGKVVETIGNGVRLVRKERIPSVQDSASNHLSEDFMREMLLADPGEQLKYLFVSQKLTRSQPVSSGEFMSWDSETRRIYYDEKQREQETYNARHSEDNYIYKQIFVANCPSDFAIPGKLVRLFALPTGAYTFTNAAKNLQLMPRFDYGQPYFGEVSNATEFFITRSGIRRKQTPQEIAAAKIAMTEKLLAWQFQQASNGIAYVQYDLAQRYFNGDGVAKNESLGHYWLQRAAAQNYDPAINFLKTLER